jgi:hypothetical protein
VGHGLVHGKPSGNLSVLAGDKKNPDIKERIATDPSPLLELLTTAF